MIYSGALNFLKLLEFYKRVGNNYDLNLLVFTKALKVKPSKTNKSKYSLGHLFMDEDCPILHISEWQMLGINSKSEGGI